jgi:hypothetical protein
MGVKFIRRTDSVSWPSNVVCKTAGPCVFDLPNRVGRGHVWPGGAGRPRPSHRARAQGRADEPARRGPHAAGPRHAPVRLPLSRAGGLPRGGRGHDGPDGPRTQGLAGHVNPTVQVVNGVPVREYIGPRGCSPHRSHGQARSGMVGLGPTTDGARPYTMAGVCAWVSRPGSDRRDHRRPRHGLVSAGLPFHPPACASGPISASASTSTSPWSEVKPSGRGHL